MGILCVFVRRSTLACTDLLRYCLSRQLQFLGWFHKKGMEADSALNELSSGEMTQWLRARACSSGGPQVQFSAATGQLTTVSNSSSLIWLLWALHISGAKANL